MYNDNKLNGSSNNKIDNRIIGDYSLPLFTILARILRIRNEDGDCRREVIVCLQCSRACCK